MSTAGESSRTRSAPDPVRITNWPLRDDGLRARGMAGGVFAVAVICGWTAGSGLMGLLTFCLLAASTWRLWVPVTFEFNSRGVVQTCWKRQRRISWPQIARYDVMSRGVLLSADAERTMLSPLRSIYVRWNDQREQLLGVLQFFLSPRSHAAIASTQTHPHA